MNEIAIAKKVEKEITTKTNILLGKVSSLDIKSIEDRDKMTSHIGDAKSGIKLVNTVLKDLNKSTKDARQSFLKLQSNLMSPFEEARYIGEKKLKKWLIDDEARRVKAQKEIDDKADADRLKEEQRVEKAQAKAESKGKVSSAKEKFIPQTTVTKQEAPEKSSFIDNWKCGEITDKMAILKQVISGTLPLSTVDINMPTMNKLAKVHEKEDAFLGVKFVNDPTIVNRQK